MWNNQNFPFSLNYLNVSKYDRADCLTPAAPTITTHICWFLFPACFTLTHTHAHLAAGLTKTGSERREWLLRRNMSVCDGLNFRVICVWMSVFEHMCVSAISSVCESWWFVLSSLNIPVDHEKNSLLLFFFFCLGPPDFWHILEFCCPLSLDILHHLRRGEVFKKEPF